MPYVGDDVHRATKRKWDHDGNEAGVALFHVLNQQEAPENANSIQAARKTLPPTKRFRPIHDDDDKDAYSSSHRRNASRELATTAATTAQGTHAGNASKSPVKINGTVLMPCHVCHRRPTKKSDLDSFARCQSCQEQTCFVCIRQCQGQGRTARMPLVAGEEEEEEEEDDEEALSRSFHMDDADEGTTPPVPSADNHGAAWQGGMSGRRPANHGIHHAMICSRCCVEQGAEGEVVCLGCLSDMDTA